MSGRIPMKRVRVKEGRFEDSESYAEPYEILKSVLPPKDGDELKKALIEALEKCHCGITNYAFRNFLRFALRTGLRLKARFDLPIYKDRCYIECGDGALFFCFHSNDTMGLVELLKEMPAPTKYRCSTWSSEVHNSTSDGGIEVRRDECVSITLFEECIMNFTAKYYPWGQNSYYFDFSMTCPSSSKRRLPFKDFLLTFVHSTHILRFYLDGSWEPLVASECKGSMCEFNGVSGLRHFMRDRPAVVIADEDGDPLATMVRESIASMLLVPQNVSYVFLS